MVPTDRPAVISARFRFFSFCIKMFCPHCGRPSLSRICKHCSLESETKASRIARRQGWLYLLVRPGVGAGLLGLLLGLMSGNVIGLVGGLLLGGLIGTAYQLLSREKRFFR